MQIAHRNYQITYITDQTALQNCVEHLNTCAKIGFDLEFDNNLHTYGFNLCLIQIASAERCFLIDPYSFDTASLQPLLAVFANPAIVKIIHAGGEDYRLLQRLGCQPKNLFDTELCANMLGYAKTSLGNVVQQNWGIEIDKGLQMSNWTKRPLTADQLRYAANDVVFLLDLHEALESQLTAAQKSAWFAQEMKAVENTSYEWSQKTDFIKKADRDEFSEYDLFVLTELFKFRDEVAQKLNKPAYQVFSDDFVRGIVRNPAQLANWPQLRGIIHYVKSESFGAKIEAAYQRIVTTATAQELGTDPTAKKRLSAAEWSEIDRQREALRVAKEQVFGPIKTQLAQQYGDFVANSTLSNNVVAELAAGTLTISKFKIDYKRTILNATAAQLGIDLKKYQ